MTYLEQNYARVVVAATRDEETLRSVLAVFDGLHPGTVDADGDVLSQEGIDEMRASLLSLATVAVLCRTLARVPSAGPSGRCPRCRARVEVRPLLVGTFVGCLC